MQGLVKGMPGVITPIFASIERISQRFIQRFMALIGGNSNGARKNGAKKNVAKTAAKKPLAKQPP